MKTLNFLLIVVAFTGILSCEKEDSKKSYPTGWFLSGSDPQNFRIGIDDQDAQHGQKSGYIECILEYTDGFGTLMQFCDGKNYAGERVKMTGYVQSLGDDNTLSLMWVRVDDYDKQVTADFDNMSDRPITGTKLWAKYEIVFDVPESSCVINYGLVLTFVGKAWIDNVSFEIVDSSTFKTAYYLNEPFPEESEFPENLPEEPVNLDFEE